MQPNNAEISFLLTHMKLQKERKKNNKVINVGVLLEQKDYLSVKLKREEIWLNVQERRHT